MAPYYPLHETRLDNGLRVIVSPDTTVPAVAVNIWYDVGSRHEEPGRSGFAHLFEHLMFQGSAHVASGRHISALQAVGASVNATTWFDRTNYFESLAVGGLDLALWLEADRMGSLLQAVTQGNLDNQREVVKEEKRQRYDNVPYGDVLEHLVKLTFPANHPYGHTTIGSMTDLDAATLDDVHAFFRAHYMPNNAVLTMVGDIAPADGFERVKRYFGAIPPGKPVPAPPVVALDPLLGQPRVERDAAVPADAVYLTWRLPAFNTRAFDAAELAMAILGDGQTSRLHGRLIRETELVQSAGTSTLGLIGGNSFGFATARARAGRDIDQIETAMINEIARLATDGPTAAELARAKAQYVRNWLQSLAALDSRADQISAAATLLNDPEEINNRLDRIQPIEASEIARATRDHIAPQGRGTVVYRASESAEAAA